jgi:hypothetical protein
MRGCPVAISSKTWSHGEVFEEKIDALSGDGESAL